MVKPAGDVTDRESLPRDLRWLPVTATGGVWKELLGLRAGLGGSQLVYRGVGRTVEDLENFAEFRVDNLKW